MVYDAGQDKHAGIGKGKGSEGSTGGYAAGQSAKGVNQACAYKIS
jgi:hypothetical protein